MPYHGANKCSPAFVQPKQLSFSSGWNFKFSPWRKGTNSFSNLALATTIQVCYCLVFFKNTHKKDPPLYSSIFCSSLSLKRWKPGRISSSLRIIPILYFPYTLGKEENKYKVLQWIWILLNQEYTINKLQWKFTQYYTTTLGVSKFSFRGSIFSLCLKEHIFTRKFYTRSYLSAKRWLFSQFSMQVNYLHNRLLIISKSNLFHNVALLDIYQWIHVFWYLPLTSIRS